MKIFSGLLILFVLFSGSVEAQLINNLSRGTVLPNVSGIIDKFKREREEKRRFYMLRQDSLQRELRRDRMRAEEIQLQRMYQERLLREERRRYGSNR